MWSGKNIRLLVGHEKTSDTWHAVRWHRARALKSVKIPWICRPADILAPVHGMTDLWQILCRFDSQPMWRFSTSRPEIDRSRWFFRDFSAGSRRNGLKLAASCAHRNSTGDRHQDRRTATHDHKVATTNVLPARPISLASAAPPQNVFGDGGMSTGVEE